MSVPDTLSAVTEEGSAVPLSFLLWLQDLVAIAAGGRALDEGVSLLEEKCFYLFIEHKEIYICVSVLHKFKMHLITLSSVLHFR